MSDIPEKNYLPIESSISVDKTDSPRGDAVKRSINGSVKHSIDGKSDDAVKPYINDNSDGSVKLPVCEKLDDSVKHSIDDMPDGSVKPSIDENANDSDDVKTGGGQESALIMPPVDVSSIGGEFVEFSLGDMSDGGETDGERDAAAEKHIVKRRLNKELMNLITTSQSGISAFPNGENIFNWIATVTGPPGSAYAKQDYKLSMQFDQNYPFAPPYVKFLTPCFHPNVSIQGDICLDILKENWSPLYEVRTILLSIQSLLGEPNIDSPLNTDAANLWADQESFKEFNHAFFEKNSHKKPITTQQQ